MEAFGSPFLGAGVQPPDSEPFPSPNASMDELLNQDWGGFTDLRTLLSQSHLDLSMSPPQTQSTSLSYVSASKNEDAAESKTPLAHLTIFYAGKVNVYDRVPEATANALMNIAAASCQAVGGTQTSANISQPVAPSDDGGLDIKQARRASLHRFLLKRKQRYSGTSPYPEKSSKDISSDKVDFEEKKSHVSQSPAPVDLFRVLEQKMKRRILSKRASPL